MGKAGKAAPVERLPSKKHSCSELQQGHRSMMAVKAETVDPEEFQQKIEDCLHTFQVVHCMFELVMGP